MGMYEDERIRTKNKVKQAAYDLYSAFRKEGMSDRDILMQVDDLIAIAPDSSRSEVYSSIKKIIEESHANQKPTTGDDSNNVPSSD